MLSGCGGSNGHKTARSKWCLYYNIKGAKLAPSVKEWIDAKCEVCETGKQVNFSFGMESGSGMYLNLIFL